MSELTADELTVDSAGASCLADGGEMGERMRALDWSRTPLGPVERWPPTLKSLVTMCLRSRFPMLIFWGREPSYTMLYNDAFIPVLGAAKHPGWLGKCGRECWTDVWPVVGPMVERVFEAGEATWCEDQLFVMDRHLSAEETYFTFSFSPIPGHGGRVDGLFCVCTETTDRVVGERRLRTLRDLAGRSSEARSAEEACEIAAQILESSHIDVPFSLIYLIGRDRSTARLVAVSQMEPGTPAAPAESDLTDFVGDEEWPLHAALLSGHPLEVADLEKRFGPLPGGPWPESPDHALVLPLAMPGHTAGFLIAGVSPRRLLDEPYRAFFNLVATQVATAVSNARAYEEERRRAQALVELDGAKTAFFSNVSHEFRTPLTLMIGPLEDALGDMAAPLPARQRERIDAAYRSSLRLLKLVNTLLDFSRIEAGRARAAFEPVDLSSFTAELASNFRSACLKAGLELTVQCEPLPHPVYVDRDMWEKIVLNLLSNAFKFTFDGEIEVTLRALDHSAELRVRDTGTGIAPEELPRLFERFHRVQGARARTVEGTGIGLALVQELIGLHGGSIRVESALGEGTSFYIRLPFGVAHLPPEQIGGERLLVPTTLYARPFVEEVLRWLPVDTAAGQEHARAPSAPHSLIETPRAALPSVEESPRSRPLVLWADDNADMREYVTGLLLPLYDVISVLNGEQALEAAQKFQPDLVLTDAMMPHMDGVALLKALRAGERTSMIPVIMLSARAGEDAKIEGFDAGADDYLAKPFSARELLARVRSQLALSKARREHEHERVARVAAELQREDFHSLFMQAPNMFTILSGPDYVVELANPPACRAVRRRHEELIHRPLFDAVPELREGNYRQLLDEVMRTGEPHLGREVPSQITWRGADVPETEYYSFVHSPLRTASGKIGGVLINAFDVTDEVVARQQMSRLRRQAESANRMKDEFLAMLGHELRNPLAPMLTALQLMRLRGITSREQDILERQVGHLTRLVDDLLDVSRITRGKIELRRRPMEVAEAVASAIEMASPVLEQRMHGIEINVPREGLAVQADPERLAQVLLNLLTNAAKYSDIGSRIVVDARRVDDRIRVSVKDEGVGIAPDMLDRVFDLFVQQPQTLDRSSGGLGLGLAIVRNLVEMHEGSVAVRSDGLGKGSEFIVELPALEQKGIAHLQPIPAAAGTGKTEKSMGTRVMVVDDNSDAAEMLTYALEALGYTVATAFDGPSALETAKTFQPEVALIDIGLPVMDGYELAQRLRAGPGGARRLKLIAVTGYGLEGDRRRSRAAGFDAHLVKPVDVDKLEQVCRPIS